MKYVQEPMTTEIIVPVLAIDSLCLLSLLLLYHTGLEWLMSRTEEPLYLLIERGEDSIRPPV